MSDPGSRDPVARPDEVTRKRHVPLAVRILTTVVAVWIVLFSGLYLVVRSFVEPSFVDLENRLALDDLLRIRGAFTQDLALLEQAADDYGTWDEMYEFAKQPSAEFVAVNLPDSIFTTLKVDLFIVYDSQQRSVFAKAVSPTTGTPHVISDFEPEQFKQQFPVVVKHREGWRFDSTKRSGTFRMTDGRLLEVATAPILKSSAQGPVVGTVVLGKIISEKLINAIRALTRLPFEVQSNLMQGDSKTDLAPQIIRDIVVVSTIWKDSVDRPIARLKLARAATIMMQGRHTLDLAMLGTIAVLTLVLLLLVLVLHKTVVAPLSRLSKEIKNIQTTGKLSTRLTLTRHDEIGVLAKSFDNLLALLSERAERLEHLATVDELTEVLNRRAIMDYLHTEVERGIRYDYSFAVLLLDVDHFKRINDTEGHAIGDRVLRNISRVLKATIRETDRLGRYGGEEFLVVVPCQTEEGVLVAADRLRLAVERDVTLGSMLPVTVSVGVAVWQGYTREGLLYIADRNLYRAKQEGRNRVVLRAVALNELPSSSLAAVRVLSRPPRKHA